MDIRYSAHPNDVKRYTTEELRREFLIENLYQPDQVVPSTAMWTGWSPWAVCR